MSRFGIPGQQRDPLAYTSSRLPVVPCVEAKRRPTVNDRNYPLWTEWRVGELPTFPASEGEFWKLVKFESNGDATWILIGSGAAGTVVALRTDDGDPAVMPDGSGVIGVLGGTGIVTSGQNPLTDITVSIDPSVVTTQFDTDAGSATPVAGVTEFVGGTGIATSAAGNTVTIALTGGGAAIDQINVDAATVPGTDPVLPDGTGQITVTAAQVAAHSVPVETHSHAANSYSIDIQSASAAASSTASQSGIAHFDSAAFTVGANGFVELIGGGSPTVSIDVDANTAPGTDPVIPNGSGQVSIIGAAVAAHSDPVETHSRSANTFGVEVQVTSDRTGAPANKNDAGLASFDDTAFVADANGYVSLIGGGSSPAAMSFNVDANTAPGTDPVLPNGSGVVAVAGAAVAAHSVPVETRSRAANAYNVEVQYASSSASTTANKSGLAHFDSADFTVDANGFVTLAIPGTGTTSFNIDAATAPGVDPTVPDGSGQVTISGAAVAAHSVPIETRARAVNAFNIEAQYASTAASSTANKSGLAHFDSGQFMVDANGFVQAIASPDTPDTFSNLGIAYNGGTGVFSITASDGSALSATNPAFLTLKSKVTPGTLKQYTVTTTYSFIDDAGASQIIGNLFGLTTGIATDQDIPFLLYFVANDAETAVTPMISRQPFSTYSPSSSVIGKPSSAIADTNLSFWAMDNGITVTQYDDNPCIRVGLFRMRMSTADDWTVQTLDYSPGNLDGISVDIPDRGWIMPTGQFGAASGGYLRPNGGTAPVFSSQRIVYSFLIGQHISVRFHLSGDGGTDGAGAVNTQMVLPFQALTVIGSGQDVFAGSVLLNASGITTRTGMLEIAYNDNITYFIDYAGAFVLNSNFGNGNRSIRGSTIYRIGGN